MHGYLITAAHQPILAQKLKYAKAECYDSLLLATYILDCRLSRRRKFVEKHRFGDIQWELNHPPVPPVELHAIRFIVDDHTTCQPDAVLLVCYILVPQYHRS